VGETPQRLKEELFKGVARKFSAKKEFHRKKQERTGMKKAARSILQEQQM